jgi:hypothetical protein
MTPARLAEFRAIIDGGGVLTNAAAAELLAERDELHQTLFGTDTQSANEWLEFVADAFDAEGISIAENHAQILRYQHDFEAEFAKQRVKDAADEELASGLAFMVENATADEDMAARLLLREHRKKAGG